MPFITGQSVCHLVQNGFLDSFSPPAVQSFNWKIPSIHLRAWSGLEIDIKRKILSFIPFYPICFPSRYTVLGLLLSSMSTTVHSYAWKNGRHAYGISIVLHVPIISKFLCNQTRLGFIIFVPAVHIHMNCIWLYAIAGWSATDKVQWEEWFGKPSKCEKSKIIFIP